MNGGTLIFSGVYFAPKEGEVITISSGSVYPNISQKQLGIIEGKVGDMWAEVREICGGGEAPEPAAKKK